MDLMDTAQAAAELRVSERTLEAWRCRGEGPPFVRIGPRRIAYRREDLFDWLDRQLFDPTRSPHPPQKAE